MKLNPKWLAAVPLAGALLLTGCGTYHVTLPNGTKATCQAGSNGLACSANGQTFSIAPGSGGGSSSQSAPADRRTPVPTNSTPSAQAVPTTAPTVNTQAAVDTCLGGNVPSQDTLLSLTTTNSTQKFAGCLALTPAETNALIALLVNDAIQAMQHHQWQTTEQRQTFTQTTVTSDVTRCEGGS